MEKVTVMESAELEKKCTEGCGRSCQSSGNASQAPADRSSQCLRKLWLHAEVMKPMLMKWHLFRKEKQLGKQETGGSFSKNSVYVHLTGQNLSSNPENIIFFFFLSLTRCQSLSWVHSCILSHLILSTTNQNCKGLVLKQSGLVSR